jgi:hypothetical protein
MSIKRGKGQGTFIESVTGLLEAFYGEISQEISPWTPKTPRLPATTASHRSLNQNPIWPRQQK